MDPPAISVIATVFQEAESIDRLLASLARQTRPPDEVVIVDGGSRDGTWERLNALSRGEEPGVWPTGRVLTLIQRPGCNISQGRNIAIAAARGPWIAATDAGVRLADDWLAALAEPIADGAPWVAGFFRSDPHGAFETALGATTLPLVAEIQPRGFLPSSRSVAFRKADWQAAGGYPEWLDYCEDLIFDRRMVDRLGPPSFAPQALVRFRPRPGLGAFVKQYYRYARGDGKADLWPRRHLIRYATYLLAMPGLLAAATSATTVARPAELLLVAGLGAMLWRPYWRLAADLPALSFGDRLAAVAWVPVIRVSGDVAKMIGYPVGRLWRWRERPPDWRGRLGNGGSRDLA